jgi:small-conductance mechanosensitive channel
MQDNFSIRDWKNETVYKEEFEGTQKVAEVEDFEADAEDIEFEIPGDENAKPVVDKDLNKSLSKQDKVIKQWQDINAQMQRNLKNFKEAGDEGAKDMAKMALKDLTPAYRAAKDAYEKLKGVKL